MLYDLTARLQNAYMVNHLSTTTLYAKYNTAVLEKLKQRNYIKSYQEINEEKIKKYINVKLYYKNKHPILRKINIISKPSQKIYKQYKDFIKLNHNNNLHKEYLLSTSKGLLWLNEAIKHKIGGELILVAQLNYKAFQKQGGK